MERYVLKGSTGTRQFRGLQPDVAHLGAGQRGHAQPVFPVLGRGGQTSLPTPSNAGAFGASLHKGFGWTCYTWGPSTATQYPCLLGLGVAPVHAGLWFPFSAVKRTFTKQRAGSLDT